VPFVPLLSHAARPGGWVAVAVEQMQGISPAGRRIFSLGLSIELIHERKVRWPSCLRLVSFDGLEYGWFVDSWLVVWRGRRVARNGRIWLVGRAGTAHAARRRLAWRERAS